MPARNIDRLAVPGRSGMAVVTVLLVGTTLACAETETTPLEVVTGAMPSEDAMATPADSIDRAIDELPGLAQDLLEESGVPGLAVAVVHGDEMVFAEGYGVKKLRSDDPVDAETVFQIASVSKSIGATVVATQVDEGVVDWSTPVADVMPELRLADPWVSEHVTIGDLYSHRSGLPSAAGDDLEDIGYDRDYVLSHLVHQPLDPFREVYHYANFGVTAGAEVVATAAGQSWEDLAQQQLFEPLGMSSTSFRHDDFLQRRNRATLHTKVGDAFEPLYQRDADAQSAAGGVSSNVIDLAKWMRLVLADGEFDGTPVIEPAALLPAISAQMISGQTAAAIQRPPHYGYGFNVGVQPGGRVSVSHSGAFVLGAATNFQLLPESDVGIIVLTNAGPIGAAEALATQFMDLVQFGTLTRDWLPAYGGALAGYYTPAGDLVDETPPASPTPHRPLDAYAGKYASDYFGPATVRVDGDHLVVDLGPSDYQLPLAHWDGDTFSFVPTGENAPSGSLSSATFTIDEDSAVTLTLEFFDANDLGTWTR